MTRPTYEEMADLLKGIAARAVSRLPIAPRRLDMFRAEHVFYVPFDPTNDTAIDEAIDLLRERIAATEHHRGYVELPLPEAVEHAYRAHIADGPTLRIIHMWDVEHYRMTTHLAVGLA